MPRAGARACVDARASSVVARRPSAAGIRVTGLDDVLVQVARCCDPLPGEEITGLVAQGSGVMVHAADCAVALEADPQRRVTCIWDGKPEALRPIRLEVLGIDQPGLLAAMSRAIAQSGMDIRTADARGIEDGKALNTFEVMVGDIADLNRVIRNLTRVKGVMRVDRVRG